MVKTISSRSSSRVLEQVDDQEIRGRERYSYYKGSMISQGEGCREDVAGGNGSTHVKR